MPITKSAKKALRQNARRRLRNLKVKNRMKSAVKNFRKLIALSKTEEARTLLPQIYKVLDKTAKAGIIKKNKASRLKSRLSALVSKKPASQTQ